MYGPAAAATPPPPPRSPGPGPRGMTVRLLFASFPIWSLGLLSWVPSLRFAVLRRRPLDWAVFGLSVALTVVYVVMLIVVPASDPEGETTASAVGGLYILVLITGAVVHAILGDRFQRQTWYAHPPSATAHGYGYPPNPYAAGPHQPGHVAALLPTLPGMPPTAPTVPAAPTDGSPYAVPAAPSSDRMRQVASELDELDEFLRKRGDGR